MPAADQGDGLAQAAVFAGAFHEHASGIGEVVDLAEGVLEAGEVPDAGAPRLAARQQPEEFEGVAQALDADAQRMERDGIVDVRRQSETPHFPAQAADAVVGECGEGLLARRRGRMEGGAVQQVAGEEDELAEMRRAQRLHGGVAVAVAAFGDEADQGGQARFDGERCHHRRGDFGEQHVHVAGRAQQCHLAAQRRQQGGRQVRRQQGREQAQRRAQAARRHAHLVDVFGIVARRRPLVVVLQVFEAGERDGAEGGQRRHGGMQRNGAGLDGCGRRAVEEAVAALGLGEQGGRKGDAVGDVAREIEQLRGLARDDFDFEFGDGLVAARGGDPAAVEGEQQGHARRRLEAPGGAQEIGLEQRRDARAYFVALQPGAHLCGIDAGEIELPGVGAFPFRARGQPGRRAARALDGLQPELPLAAQAQGNAALAQFLRRRVVIEVDEALGLARNGALQQRMAQEGALRGFRQGELEFDFVGHECASAIEWGWRRLPPRPAKDDDGLIRGPRPRSATVRRPARTLRCRRMHPGHVLFIHNAGFCNAAILP